MAHKFGMHMKTFSLLFFALGLSGATFATPLISAVEAGLDQEIVEYQAERRPFPRAWLRMVTSTPAEQLYWAQGVGNSMEPTIGDGEVILIDRSKVGSSFGDLYWAVAYGQTGMIKRLRPMPDGSVKILSNNPSVPPEVAYDGELHIFGRVVAVVRRL